MTRKETQLAATEDTEETLDSENQRHREAMVLIREHYETQKAAEEGQHYLNVQRIRANSRG